MDKGKYFLKGLIFACKDENCSFISDSFTEAVEHVVHDTDYTHEIHMSVSVRLEEDKK